ncbi:MAG: phosphatase PAP2 family protein [Acidobacteriota bacterium]|nr:phosphatase PAP2 family protein [Acidobacteriota bacterium]
MSIPRQKLLRFACCCFVFGAANAYGSKAVAQGSKPFDERAIKAQIISEARQRSGQQNEREAHDQASDGGATGNTACGVHEFSDDTWTEVSHFGQGLKATPRGIIRPNNLKWELPIAAVTSVLIAKVDKPADNRIQSLSFQQNAGRWSNAGLGAEIGAGVLAYGIGCGKHNSYLRDTGFKALAAMGAAGSVDLALKLAFDRQFPSKTGGGKFWGGGRSFPSGHSATSFAFAAVVAHRYPDRRWVKWAAYGLATAVSLSRYPAKKHFPSDILIGATLGYVTGTYLAER